MGGGQRGCSPDPIPQEEWLFSLPHSLCPPPNHSLSGRKASMHPGVILKWVGRGMWCGWESESSLKMYVGPWAGGQEAAGSDRERLDPDQWHVGLRSWGRGLRASEDPGYDSSSGSSCNTGRDVLGGEPDLDSISVFVFETVWPCCTACGILVPWSGIEPAPPAMEVWSLNR